MSPLISDGDFEAIRRAREQMQRIVDSWNKSGAFAQTIETIRRQQEDFRSAFEKINLPALVQAQEQARQFAEQHAALLEKLRLPTATLPQLEGFHEPVIAVTRQASVPLSEYEGLAEDYGRLRQAYARALAALEEMKQEIERLRRGGPFDGTQGLEPREPDRN